ncbi:MAG: class I SAM-dependent RNA methyltransferase [Bryobacteraceae bacterium]
MQLHALREKPGLIRATPVAILEPSAARVPPPCPYFGRCGGCHYQHASYEAQLAAKRAILVEELWRQAKFRVESEIATVAGEPWGYRNRVQLHIEEGRLGYREAGSHKLCAIDRCPIASPKINAAIAVVNAMMKDRRWPRFVRSIELFSDEDSVQLNVVDTERPVAKQFFDWRAETIAGLVPGALDYRGEFRVSGNSFFQVNRFLLDALVEAALEGAQGETSIDLYAGVGLFTLPLARCFRHVAAIESGAGAVRDLRWNVERAGLTNVRAEQQAAEKFLASLDRASDFMLLDPPRAGLGPKMVAQLLRLRPAKLTIVACDPVTLGRDLAGLIEAGYRIEGLTMVDLFPQTFHLETIVRMAV